MIIIILIYRTNEIISSDDDGKIYVYDIRAQAKKDVFNIINHPNQTQQNNLNESTSNTSKDEELTISKSDILIPEEDK